MKSNLRLYRLAEHASALIEPDAIIVVVSGGEDIGTAVSFQQQS